MTEGPKDVPEFVRAAAPPAPLAQISAPGSSPPAQTLLDFTRELEKWALMNQRDAKDDLLKFWALKVPAIAASTCAGLFVHFELNTISVIASTLGSVFIVLDGLLRPGMLRKVHVRALYDLRDLQSEVTRQWQIGCFQKKDENELAAEILSKALEKRSQIQAYLSAAESSVLEREAK